MAVFGYLMMRWLVFPLADEVFLDEDEVIVRKNGKETRFSVRQIINVDASLMTNPNESQSRCEIRVSLDARSCSSQLSGFIFFPVIRSLKN